MLGPKYMRFMLRLTMHCLDMERSNLLKTQKYQSNDSAAADTRASHIFKRIEIKTEERCFIIFILIHLNPCVSLYYWTYQTLHFPSVWSHTQIWQISWVMELFWVKQIIKNILFLSVTHVVILQFPTIQLCCLRYHMEWRRWMSQTGWTGTANLREELQNSVQWIYTWSN